jgi:hypothetical protein
VEETRAECGGTELLIHVHGEPLTKDKWMTVHGDGAPLRLLQVLPTALTGIGSLPAVGNRVQLLVMDHKLVQLIASRRTGEDPSAVEVPTLVGVVVKVLPARDASLVDVAYPAELLSATPDEAQWQRVQIGNGYVRLSWLSSSRFSSLKRPLCLQINVISEWRFGVLQQQLAFALGAPPLGYDKADHYSD